MHIAAGLAGSRIKYGMTAIGVGGMTIQGADVMGVWPIPRCHAELDSASIQTGWGESRDNCGMTGLSREITDSNSSMTVLHGLNGKSTGPAVAPSAAPLLQRTKKPPRLPRAAFGERQND